MSKACYWHRRYHTVSVGKRVNTVDGMAFRHLARKSKNYSHGYESYVHGTNKTHREDIMILRLTIMMVMSTVVETLQSSR